MIITEIGNSFSTTPYYRYTWKSEDQKKIAENSLSGFLSRIYKPYSGGILITEAAFLINQYCISEQSISSLSQLQRKKKKGYIFQQLSELINAIYSSDSNQWLSGSLSLRIDL